MLVEVEGRGVDHHGPPALHKAVRGAVLRQPVGARRGHHRGEGGEEEEVIEVAEDEAVQLEVDDAAVLWGEGGEGGGGGSAHIHSRKQFGAVTLAGSERIYRDIFLSGSGYRCIYKVHADAKPCSRTLSDTTSRCMRGALQFTPVPPMSVDRSFAAFQ